MKKLSPKMQTLLDALNAGTASVFQTYGGTHLMVYGMGKGAAKWTPTAKALIERGILVPGTEKNSWVLA